MNELIEISNLIESSRLTEKEKQVTIEYISSIKKKYEVKKFIAKRLEENLIINTRFLDKAVNDLEKTVELLQISNRQLSSFVKIASHDLKSPLRSISSFSGLLDKILGDKLSKKEKEYFGIIEKSAKSMAALIDDLLLFTRINAEKLNVQDEDLNIMLNEVLQSLDYDIQKNNAIVERVVKPISLKCDPIKFKQLLQNLIANGIKFSSFEGSIPHIVIELNEDATHWIFKVQDNGIGISDDYRNEVFNEFKKLNGESFEGTGMGLSICKKIVNKHNGEIWVSPEVVSGTEFVFTIDKNL